MIGEVERKLPNQKITSFSREGPTVKYPVEVVKRHMHANKINLLNTYLHIAYANTFHTRTKQKRRYMEF